MVSFGNGAKILLAFFVLVVSPHYLFAAGESIGGFLQLGLLNYDPYPAEPGEYATLWIEVDSDKLASSGVECELRPEYPFSLDPTDTGLKSIGGIPVGQPALLKYRVRVDDKAASGDYELKFACKSAGVDWVEVKLDVSVQGNPVLVLSPDISLSPEKPSSGSPFDLGLVIENNGNGAAKHVTAELTTDNEIRARGSSVAFVEEIASGGSATIRFRMDALKDATEGAHSNTLTLTYDNDVGEAMESKTYSFGVFVTQPEARLATSRIKTTPETLKQDEKATIEIRIENYGYGEARNVRTALLFGNQSFSSIVGKIPGEDRANANFFVPKVSGTGIVDTTLRISYEDSSGEHSFDAPVQFVIEERAQGASILPYVVLLAVLVILFFNRHRVMRFLQGKKE